jgi:outer membrane immunogenic protein
MFSEAVMRKKLAIAVAVAGLIGTPAFAADLAVKAPPPPPPPPFSWTGFYIGGHAGAGIMLDQGFLSPDGGPACIGGCTVRVAADRHGIGGLAGGQIGYNWQIGQLVLGIEGEGFWSGMKVTADSFDVNTLVTTTTIKNKWDWDIAGRFGLAFNRALVYGKAGWVEGGFQWNVSGFGFPDLVTGNHNLDGLLIGIGLEYAFDNNWTAKFEYDYLGFPAKDVLFTEIARGTFTQSVSADKHIFKVGFNYLFNPGPAVVAKY